MTVSESLTPIGHGANGCLSSFCTISILQPLFTVKTYVMANKGLPPLARLYHGYSSNLACDISNEATAFFAFGFFKQISKNDFLNAMGAGISCAVPVNFLERSMILQQLHNHENKAAKKISITEVTKVILQKEGYRGLVKGVRLTIARESINCTCFFALSKVVHSKIEKIISDRNTATASSYLSVGMLSGFITTPIDILKTRVQQELSNDSCCVKEIKKFFIEEQSHVLKNMLVCSMSRTATIGLTILGLGMFSQSLPSFFPEQLKNKSKD